MLRSFIRGIILATMCCVYSTYSVSLMSEIGHFVINSFVETETMSVKPKFIREWVFLPINRFFPLESYMLEQYLKKNIGGLIGSEEGIDLIAKALKNNSIARKSIVTTIVDNFEKILALQNGKSLIKIVIQNHPILVQWIVLSTVKFPYRWNSIMRLIEESPVETQTILCIKENYIEGKITSLPLPLFSYFCDAFPNDKRLRTKLKEDSDKHSLRGVIKKTCYLQSLSEDKKSGKLKLNFPTVKHIERYARDIVESKDTLEYTNAESYFSSMLDKVFQKEMELESNGYVAFKHSQRWCYGLPEKWFTSLWEVTKEKLATNFMFLHVKPLLKNHSLADENKLRENLLAKGADYSKIKYTLCMNYMIFGNTNSTGSSSVYYALYNENCGDKNISLTKVFYYLGCEKIYKKYEKQLQELEQEYQTISQYGSMVVIGVPEDRLVDSVYLGDSWFGSKKGKLYIEGIGETDNIKTVITTLRNNPERIKNSNHVEFVLTMTQDKHGGLNPESGIKMHMFNAADPEKLAAFRKKENILLGQIKQEIKQQKNEHKKNILDFS